MKEHKYKRSKMLAQTRQRIIAIDGQERRLHKSVIFSLRMLSKEIFHPVFSLERLIKPRRTSSRNKNSIVNETETSKTQKYRNTKQKDTW